MDKEQNYQCIDEFNFPSFSEISTFLKKQLVLS